MRARPHDFEGLGIDGSVLKTLPRVVWLITLALSGCGSSARVPVVVPPVEASETALGSGDVFDVRVYGEEALSGTHQVASDGSIDFPLVGRVQVRGREPTEVADMLSAKLRAGHFLKHPQVSVLVQEYASKRVTVMGAVNRAGTFPLTSGLTVVQAISLAGGFTPLANRNGTLVIRRVGGERRRIRVPAAQVAEGRVDDFPVQAGDTIQVPERLF